MVGHQRYGWLAAALRGGASDESLGGCGGGRLPYTLSHTRHLILLTGNLYGNVSVLLPFHSFLSMSVLKRICRHRARCGCDIIDFATASMADGTSQPSLNGTALLLLAACL